MPWKAHAGAHGLDALREAVVRLLMVAEPSVAGIPQILFNEAVASPGSGSGPGGYGDSDLAASSEDSEADRTRLIALVELARKGDADAFGLLYDHYHSSVYRFLFYRTRSTALAEDLTSETFFRALRSMTNFRWQGKDFGAWLMTIARNLATDHFKAGRTRLEMTTEDMGQHDDTTEGPESLVLASLTNEILLGALTELGARGVQSLLLEGGPHLAGVFLEAGEIDEARIFVAPMLAGGKDARAAIEGEGVEQIHDAVKATSTQVERIDDDVLITSRVRDW